MINARSKGFHRDKLVLASIQDYEVLNTDQVYVLHFSDSKYGIVKARQRLRKLYGAKKVRRAREDIAEPCYYYTGKKPASASHIVNKNWGIIYMLNRMKEWDQLIEMQREYVLGKLQADGFIGIKNKFTGIVKYYFIESDKTDSRNQFKKVKIYNDLYRSNAYVKEPWVKNTDKFPEILIVTDTEKKAERIKRHIAEENREGLRITVITVDEIKESLFPKYKECRKNSN